MPSSAWATVGGHGDHQQHRFSQQHHLQPDGRPQPLHDLGRQHSTNLGNQVSNSTNANGLGGYLPITVNQTPTIASQLTGTGGLTVNGRARSP